MARRSFRFPPFRTALSAFAADESGSYAMITALALPALLGFAGLSTEITLWLQRHQQMQGAADSAALSAATAFINAGDKDLEGKGIAATYGFTDGSNGTVVVVNQPPASGSQPASAIEVIIRQPQTPLFSALWSTIPIAISARAVANGVGGSGCVLALNKTASSAVSLGGNTDINLTNCSLFADSNSTSAVSVSGSAHITAQSLGVVGGVSGASKITTTDGIATGFQNVPDPYAGVRRPTFSGCNQDFYTTAATVTLNPGVFCNGLTLTSGARVTLRPGVYFIDRGTLSLGGNTTLTGTGVTIVFTSSTGSNWATANIGANSTITLTPPTTGTTAGISLYGDRSMPAGTSFTMGGGSGQKISGAIYLPKADLSYSGNSATSASCTQVIVDTITFSGTSGLAINCSGFPVRSIGSTGVALLE